MTPSKSRRKAYLISGIGGALLVSGLIALLGRSPVLNRAAPSDATAQISVSKLGASLPVAIAAPSPTALKAPVLTLLRAEAARVGQADADPQGTEARLKRMAGSLLPADQEKLASAAIDPSEAGDARFLASYILALSGGVEPLLEVARKPMPDLDGDAPERSVEIAVRAQAIEGLTGQPAALRALIGSVSDPFLADRAQRALYATERPQGGPVSLQDETALKKVFRWN